MISFSAGDVIKSYSVTSVLLNAMAAHKDLNFFVPEKTASHKVKKAAREVKQILSEIFQRQEIPPVLDKHRVFLEFPGAVTITDVKMSSDLQECTVFFLPFANINAEKTLLYFEAAAPAIRKVFAKKSVFRMVPNFRFELDSNFFIIDRIEELLKKNTMGTEVFGLKGEE
ncbi:MAG: ribosome-binding factor A [Holosporales bacterium]|jgi:ribosome-binding factor A|nr:ribosome-binding factor A [Holosporales bacterium]